MQGQTIYLVRQLHIYRDDFLFPISANLHFRTYRNSKRLLDKLTEAKKFYKFKQEFRYDMAKKEEV